MEVYISDVIKKYGLTQQKVAERMGLSLQNIRKIASCQRAKPTISTLERIAEAIGCDPLEFFYDPKSKKERVVSTFTDTETGKKYKIVEIAMS